MRKLMFGILLASVAATPALAAPADRQDRQQAREDRQQAREQRDRSADVARPERAQRVERPEQVERADRPEPRARLVEGPALAEARARADQRNLQVIRDARRPARDLRPATPQARPAIDPRDRGAVRERNEQRRLDVRERMIANHNARPPVISTTPRPGTQPPPPVVQRPTSPVQWNGNWRNDNRYDWSKHRHRHRSLFNLGFYYDPFGWGYQRYNVGWRMWPSYYSNQYWLNDPWQYRLPYAPAGYRWVRYWDDAVLVDTWSGQVVDVIYSFFW